MAQVGIELNRNDSTYSRDLGTRCATLSNAVGSASPEDLPIIVSRSDFDSLPVQPLVFGGGPPELDWIPVNMDVILYAESEEQQLDTTLLGAQVSVRAIPVEYTWDMGNGDVFTTDHPGAPYPSKSIVTQYPVRGWYDITLTTTFRGEFSVNGGPWQPIDGTITRQSDPIELYARSMRARNVNGPTDEDWRDWQPPARTEDTEGEPLE